MFFFYIAAILADLDHRLGTLIDIEIKLFACRIPLEGE
jgi:hypothetical protein